MSVKPKVILKTVQDGQLGLKIDVEVYLGGNLVNANQFYVSQTVDGITNLTDTKADDAIVDPVARAGLSLVPEKTYILGGEEVSETVELDSD